MKRKKRNKTNLQSTPTKMSEVILNFAWSYAIQDVTDPHQRQHFMNVACFAWNFSLLPEEGCRRAIANYVDNMRTAGGAEADEADMQALTNDLYTLVEHKKKHYPTIRKLVVSAELYNECTTKEIMSDAAQYPQIMMQW